MGEMGTPPLWTINLSKPNNCMLKLTLNQVDLKSN